MAGTLGRLGKIVRVTLAASALAVTIGSLGVAHTGERLPASSGTYDHGSIDMPLHRGNVVPFELTVAKTPDNCSGNLRLRIDWNQEANEVRVRLDGQHALTPYPTVHRTEGVEYFPNPFLPEPKDVVNGRNEFWLVTPGPDITFYYDGTTLNLLGSELDFPTPPAGAIPLPLPTLVAVGSPFFEPDDQGNVHFEWKFPYDKVTRGDLPQFGQHYVSFPPPNLCGANPYRFDLSTARIYMSKPVPAAEALPFSDYLRAGLIFDVTIDPPQYYVYPPLTTLIATYSGATVVAGGIPKGWMFDIDAAFMNVAPPIRPWPAAGSCANWFDPMHTKGLNFCPPPSP
jgi:hypothetical protein